MPTPKQAAFLRALMVERGFAHPDGYLRGDAKHLPHNPTMRERGAGAGALDAWIARLTVSQASEVIDFLKRK